MDTAFILHLFAAVLVLIGLAGIVLPALPGVPLVFAGLLLAAWSDGFRHVAWPTLLVLAGLTALSLLVDLAATALGAKGFGASRLAVWGALAGTVAGLFFMPLGLLIGPFAGAWLGEYAHSRRAGQATRAGLGTWLGIVLGAASKLAIALAMLLLFALAWWR